MLLANSLRMFCNFTRSNFNEFDKRMLNLHLHCKDTIYFWDFLYAQDVAQITVKSYNVTNQLKSDAWRRYKVLMLKPYFAYKYLFLAINKITKM